MKVSIVVLQFNNSRDTIKCLESVKELDYPDFEVVVVDNASKTEHLNSIRLFIESQSHTKREHATSRRGFVRDEGKNRIKFHLLVNQRNLGYAGGNNIGIRCALENGADYVLILNPDTIVKKDLLAKLAGIARKNPKTGIVGAAVSEGDRIIYCGKIKWLKPELEHSILKPKTCNLKPSFYIPGVVMLINRKVFKKVGGFDEKYFLYFEDADFCIRARKAKFKLAVVPKVLIRHEVSSSTSGLGPALLLRYHYRNTHLFNAKNGPFWARILLPFWSVWIIIKQVIKLLLRINVPVSRAILNGVFDFYKGRFGKIY